MMRAVPLLLAVLAAAPVQAQVTLGRLFSTPFERAEMENARGSAPAQSPNAESQQPAPGTPGGPPPPAAAATPAAAAAAPVERPNAGYSGYVGVATGRSSVSTINTAGVSEGRPSTSNIGSAALVVAPPNTGTAAPAAPVAASAAAPRPQMPPPPAAPTLPPPPPPPPALTMNGVLRSSDNRTTVWLNGIPQTGQQNNLSRRGADSPKLTVTLPSGKKVVLKAGQRYDLNEGRIKDINEP